MSRRGLYLPIISDPTSLLRALRTGRLAVNDFAGSAEKGGMVAAQGMRQAGIAANGLSVDMNKVAIAAERSVKVQVAAEAKRTARLRQEIALFNQQAAAAKRGSAEAILNSNLSRRAQRELAFSMGVTSKEADHLTRSSGRANNELGRGLRGALAGSGIFRALGRSLAFASGGFLIFASGASFLRNSVDAAREWLTTQRSLSAQFKANGQDLGAYRGQITATVDKISQLGGFTRDDLTKAFTIGYRQIGSTTVALRLMTDAAGVARGRNLPLWTSVLGLTKAYGGQSTALRRLGILVPAHANGMEVLRYVEQKFAGQLKANTTEAERFHASLYNLEESAGGVLLPVVSHLQSKFAAWAGNTKNQVLLQQQLKQALSGVGFVIKTLYTIVSGIVSLFGGWKNAIVIIAAAWVGLKVKAIAAAIAVRVANVAAAWDSARAWQESSVISRVSAYTTRDAQIAAAAAAAAANDVAAAETAAAWRAALISTGWGILAVAAGAAAGYIYLHWKDMFGQLSVIDDEVKTLTADFYALSRAGSVTDKVINAKQAYASAVVNRDQARQAVAAAQAEEKATNGTKKHADAVDQLRLAVQNLISANRDLSKQQGLEAGAVRQQRARVKNLVQELTNAPWRVAIAESGNDMSGWLTHLTTKQFAAQMANGRKQGVYFDPKMYAKNVLQILQGATSVKTPGAGSTSFREVLRALYAIDVATNKLPSQKTTRILVEAEFKGSGFGDRLLASSGKVDLSHPIKNFQAWWDSKFALLSTVAKLTKGKGDDLKVVNAEEDAIKAALKAHLLKGAALAASMKELERLNTQLFNLSRVAKQQTAAGPKGPSPIEVFQTWFDTKFGLAAAKASATPGSADDLSVAQEEKRAVLAAIRAKRLSGSELIAAYNELGTLNQAIASDVKKAFDFGTRYNNRFGLAIAEASATLKTGDDIGIAKQARVWVQAQISTGKLKGQTLIDAYTQLSSLNSQIASAAQAAAQKAQQARDALRQNVDTALTQIGTLFSGPILNPTSEQIKQQLGVLPPTVQTINRDLAAQNAESKKWLRDIHKLTRDGAPKQLIQELIAAGPADAQYVHQLATASKKALAQYFKEYRDRVKLGLQVATVKLTSKNVDLVAQSVVFKNAGSSSNPKHPDSSHHRHRTTISRPHHVKVTNPNIHQAPRIGALRSNRVHLHANTVVMPNSAGDAGGDIIFKVDGDVLARATLPRHQRRARRQVVQVRGRRGGDNLALG